MGTSKMLPFVIHILVLFSLSFETATLENREGRALLKWKNTLSNTHDVLHSWSIANLDNVCWNWMGVTCNNVGALYEIKLENLNLSGTLESLDFISFQNLTHFSLYNNTFIGSVPYTIANLSQLRSLDLSWNYFQNFIPTEIQRLTKLRSLNLGENNLKGTIPSQIFSNMSKLRYFDCSNNLFQGPFPRNLVKLSMLKELSLAENQFSGSIPPTIGNLSSLRVLDLSDNMLQRTIPLTLCNLHSLEYLDLSKNSLDGVIPKCLGNVTSLLSLSISSNILQGSIPKTLCNLHSLGVLYLDSNSLRGSIPPCLGNVTSLNYLSLSSNILRGNIPKGLCNLQQSLEVLILSNNSLDGSVPQCLGKLKFLTTLIVSKNQLQGMITPTPTPTPTLRNDTNQTTNSSLIYARDTWLCGLSSLKFLDLSDNNLHGPLPQCLENFSRELVVINLARNQFQGFIPGVCTNKNSLEYFNLNGNQFSGSLPQDLINCNNLKFIDLGDNMLHDSFPHWLDTLPDLRVLVLRSNQFYGEICTSNTTLPFQKLHIFDISNNEFSGPLPRYYMKNFEAMQHTNDDGALSAFEASISLVWKGVEVQVVHYDIFTLLDLSNNFFHGVIPRSLGKLCFIRFLNLSHNQLTGNIPSSLGNLTLLEVLDLSCNQLAGNIPRQLSRSLTFLAVLNLSYNHLSGPIPHGSQFNTFGNDSYLENMALCGLPLTLKCQDMGEGKTSNEKDSQHFGSGLGWQSVIVGYCFGAPVGISIGYFLFKYGNLGWLKSYVLQFLLLPFLFYCCEIVVFGLHSIKPFWPSSVNQPMNDPIKHGQCGFFMSSVIFLYALILPISTLPMNISSIFVLESSSNAGEPVYSKVITSIVVVFVVFACLVISLAVFFFLHHRRYSEKSHRQKTDNLRLVPPNATPSDAGFGGDTMKKPRLPCTRLPCYQTKASSTSSEFLYLGTRVSSWEVNEDQLTRCEIATQPPAPRGSHETEIVPTLLIGSLSEGLKSHLGLRVAFPFRI
ncbi:PREDICTED: receptor like protein 30-like [Ipomoea nil]|uniref:receptor like protein 30-like n=1 Tax=Ipomoea nil TaxID=35883 RepID=UPI0009015409|nr:PREDICTED: receptor like protein 30-like [Ipomoea nil]